MREPDEMAWYAVTIEDGSERVMHAVVSSAPEDARPITEEEAREISARLRSAPVPEEAPSSRAAVDLSGILSRLEALSEESIAQTEKIEAVTSKVERVEGAMNDMTAGLTGERTE